jgi:hypothetical protein
MADNRKQCPTRVACCLMFAGVGLFVLVTIAWMCSTWWVLVVAPWGWAGNCLAVALLYMVESLIYKWCLGETLVEGCVPCAIMLLLMLILYAQLRFTMNESRRSRQAVDTQEPAAPELGPAESRGDQ